jgi:glycosyltransferase involved in cell wall biosynthesis
MKKKILLIQRIFSSYRKPIFDRLARDYDFLFLHSKNNSGIKQLHTDYSKIIKSIKYGKKETNVILCYFVKLFKFKPDIVIHEFNPSILSLYLLFFLRFFMGFKIILWGHGYNQSKYFNPKGDLSSYIRLKLIELSDAVIFYGEKAKKEISNFVNEDKLFIAYNSLDTVTLSEIFNNLKSRNREKMKEEIGFSKKINIIFVGRMLQSKILPNKFIEIIQLLNQKLNDLEFHFIGDGEEYKNLKRKVNELKINNVKFYGAIYDDVLIGKYLYCSELLLNPGYLGLSVNHAFAFEIPVFSFAKTEKGPFHSPEVEYVIDKKTGFLIDGLDTKKMCDAIIDYLGNNELREKIRENISELNKDKCNIVKMYNGFEDAINYVCR